MPAYEEVLNIAHQNVRQLGDQLNELIEIKQRLQEARKIPDQWDEKFQEIAATTRKYTSAINQVANTYLKDSNQVIGNNLAAFDAATVKLDGQIQTLINYDFAAHFKMLQEEVALQVKTDLQQEVKGVKLATSDLDATNDAFKQEVTRLGKVDLDMHFNRHQKMLSDVFNAINSINSLLSTSTQTLVLLQTGQAEVRRVVEEQHKVVLAKIVDNSAVVRGLRTVLYIALIVLLITSGVVIYKSLVS